MTTMMGHNMVYNKNKQQHNLSLSKTLFAIDSEYEPIKILGKGSYGVVCSAINKKTNEKVAVKKISNLFEHRVCTLRALREIMILRFARHPNVIHLKDVMIDARNGLGFSEVYLVYEFMDTDLQRIIDQSPMPITNLHCKYFLFQLLRGLQYLHSVNVLHRDLKPANLLVNGNLDLKICDFGLARTAKEKGQFMTEYVVTRWYRAPELLLRSNTYGAPIDVWSVGCILAELLGRKPIFPGASSLSQLDIIITVLGTPKDNDLDFIEDDRTRQYIKSTLYSRGFDLAYLFPDADPLAVDLLKKMLVFNPNKRISVAEALRHPYLSGLFDPKENPSVGPPFVFHAMDELHESTLRALMLREMLFFRPHEKIYLNFQK